MSEEDALHGLGAEPSETIDGAHLAPTAAKRWADGTHLGGQYRILEILGTGGMGEVYLARDVVLGRRVAIKTLRPSDEVAMDPSARAEYIQLFQRDATSTARLNHPNIVTIHSTGVHEETPFMVLEYLRGSTLEDYSPQDTTALARLGASAARALEYAHQRGVIHRDIKPANLFITEDHTIKILDFGVALLQMNKIVAAEDTDMTAEELRRRIGQGSTIAGTPAYMAPEQLIGDVQDHRVDIWAMGVVLFELLTGERPSKSARETLDGDLAFSLLEGHEESITRIIRECLRTDPRARIASAAELARKLEQAGLRFTAPTPQVQFTRRHHTLPSMQGDTIGRDQELEQLLELVMDTTHTIMITGPVGVGKSRLAIELAHRVRDFFELIFYCDMRGRESLAGAHTALREAMTTSGDRGGTPPKLEHIKTILASSRRALVVLDNLDDLGEDGAQLLALFREANRASAIVMTSSESLRIRDEYLFALNPLSLPNESEDGAALRLYFSLAPEIEEQPHERAEARALMAHLDGLPLAIELAASRARTLTPSALRARLSRRFDILRKTSPMTLPGAQMAMEEALSAAWRRLDEPQRQALVQAAIFEGPFSLDAGEEVVQFSPDLDEDPFAFDVLEQLVERSMIQPDDERLALLETTRAFSYQRLEEVLASDEREDLARRHALFFASGWEDEASDEASRVDMLSRNMRDLQRALDATIARQDLETCRALLSRIGEVATSRGPREQLSGALERARQLLAPHECEQISLLRAQAASLRGDTTEQERHATAALLASERASNGAVMREALLILANAASARGQMDEARAMLERARRASTLEPGMVRLLLEASALSMAAGDLDEAMSHARHALELALARGAHGSVARASCHLAMQRWLRGEIADAQSAYQEILDAGFERDRADIQVRAHLGLGRIAIYEEEYPLARAHLDRARALYESLGFEERGYEETSGLLGVLATSAGKHHEALERFHAALAIATRRQDVVSIQRWKAHVADCWWEGGQQKRAERAWGEVLSTLGRQDGVASRQLVWEVRLRAATRRNLGGEQEQGGAMIGNVLEEIERARVTPDPILAHALRLASASFLA